MYFCTLWGSRQITIAKINCLKVRLHIFKPKSNITKTFCFKLKPNYCLPWKPSDKSQPPSPLTMRIIYQCQVLTNILYTGSIPSLWLPDPLASNSLTHSENKGFCLTELDKEATANYNNFLIRSCWWLENKMMIHWGKNEE